MTQENLGLMDELRVEVLAAKQLMRKSICHPVVWQVLMA
jgi:hypothetical protein